MADDKKIVRNINIRIELGEDRYPEKISWEADESGQTGAREAKSMMMSFWDTEDQTTLRFDLHTRDCYIDEMNNHFLQSLITMADAYQKATGHTFALEKMKTFCNELYAEIEEEGKRRQSKN